MNTKQVLTVLFALAVLVRPGLLYAQSEAAFFSTLPDIPLKPGLVELEEQSLSFDKPEGRIIESVALIESGSAEDTADYYRTVLPEFGWQKIGEQHYKREAEELRFHVDRVHDDSYLVIRVYPG